MCYNATIIVTRKVIFHKKFMTIFQHKNVGMQSIPKVDELKVSWDDSICKLIHKKCHRKNHHSDIKWDMTLNAIFSIVMMPQKMVGIPPYLYSCPWNENLKMQVANIKCRVGILYTLWPFNIFTMLIEHSSNDSFHNYHLEYPIELL